MHVLDGGKHRIFVEGSSARRQVVSQGERELALERAHEEEMLPERGGVLVAVHVQHAGTQRSVADADEIARLLARRANLPPADRLAQQGDQAVLNPIGVFECGRPARFGQPIDADTIASCRAERPSRPLHRRRVHQEATPQLKDTSPPPFIFD